VNARFKKIVWGMVPRSVQDYYNLLQRVKPTHLATCPICKFEGYFKNYGTPPRLNAMCPRCGALERHRLFFLSFLQNESHACNFLRTPILHFAPEPVIEDRLRKKFQKQYQTADLYTKTDLKLNIEKINLPDDSISTVICMHVLEHVDDEKALSEMHRIMKNNSILILAFPIIENWAQTYKNSAITDEQQRKIHFGQSDHNKYYGQDVRQRIKFHGFRIIQEIKATPEMCVEFNLLRGETLFLCEKLNFVESQKEDFK